MADPVREYDKTIIAEAERQRKYDLATAQVEKEKEANRLREQRLHREDRRTFIGFTLLGAAIVAIILSIVVGVIRGTEADRRNRENQEIRNVQIADACIKAGNIWINGDCLLANKDPQ